MTYSQGSPGYAPGPPSSPYGAPSQPKAGADPAQAGGAGKLPMYLFIAVAVLGLAVYLAAFGPKVSVSGGGPLSSLNEVGYSDSYAVVAAVLAALLAGAGLLPKQKKFFAVVAVVSVLAFLLAVSDLFGLPDGTSFGWGLILSVVFIALQVVAAVGALLVDAGIVSAPAPRPKYAQQYGGGSGPYYVGPPQGGPPQQFGGPPQPGPGQQYGPPPQQAGPPQQNPGYPSQYGSYPSQSSSGQPSSGQPSSGQPSSSYGEQSGPPTTPTGFASFPPPQQLGAAPAGPPAQSAPQSSSGPAQF